MSETNNRKRTSMPYDNDAFDMKNDPIWEPLNELEMAPVDIDGEIFEGGKHQQYLCYVIGHALRDAEGCCSLVEINTGLGQNNDMVFAKMILDALKFKRNSDDAKARQKSLF